MEAGSFNSVFNSRGNTLSHIENIYDGTVEFALTTIFEIAC